MVVAPKARASEFLAIGAMHTRAELPVRLGAAGKQAPKRLLDFLGFLGRQVPSLSFFRAAKGDAISSEFCKNLSASN
jgi:hypothetical protein